MSTSKSTESRKDHQSVSSSFQFGNFKTFYSPKTREQFGILTLWSDHTPKKAQISDVQALTPQQMKRFARSASMFTRKVLMPARSIASSCCIAETHRETRSSKPTQVVLRLDESYEASHFSSECNEEALKKATCEIEYLLREQTKEQELGSNSSALVETMRREHRELRQSIESADEEIDISGVSRVSEEKIRTWEVRNVRMFRERRPAATQKKKTFFRKMLTRFES